MIRFVIVAVSMVLAVLVLGLTGNTQGQLENCREAVQEACQEPGSASVPYTCRTEKVNSTYYEVPENFRQEIQQMDEDGLSCNS